MPPEQDPRYMGSFQFNGFSFGVEGSSMAHLPKNYPPLNAFLVWRNNIVHSGGGFGLGVDTFITPGLEGEKGAGMADIILEHNIVRDSEVPILVGSCGVENLYLRGNTFTLP